MDDGTTRRVAMSRRAVKRYRTARPRWAYHHPPVKILLANPRGFCAGVYMAIDVVDQLLDICGGEANSEANLGTSPQKIPQKIYVYHEIVHNRHVVQRFRDRGAVFVESIDEVPEGSMVSTHDGVRLAAVQPGARFFDAAAQAQRMTCPNAAAARDLESGIKTAAAQRDRELEDMLARELMGQRKPRAKPMLKSMLKAPMPIAHG